jgi:hypothetical protein
MYAFFGSAKVFFLLVFSVFPYKILTAQSLGWRGAFFAADLRTGQAGRARVAGLRLRNSLFPSTNLPSPFSYLCFCFGVWGSLFLFSNPA